MKNTFTVIQYETPTELLDVESFIRDKKVPCRPIMVAGESTESLYKPAKDFVVITNENDDAECTLSLSEWEALLKASKEFPESTIDVNEFVRQVMNMRPPEETAMQMYADSLRSQEEAKRLESFMKDQKQLRHPGDGPTLRRMKDVSATPQRAEAWHERQRLVEATKYVNIVRPNNWTEGCCINCERTDTVPRDKFILDSARNSLDYDGYKLKATKFEFPVWIFSAQTFSECIVKVGDVIFPNHCIHVHTHPMWDYDPEDRKILQIRLPPHMELFMYAKHDVFGFFAAIMFIKSFKVSEIIDDLHVVVSDVDVHTDVFSDSTASERFEEVSTTFTELSGLKD